MVDIQALKADVSLVFLIESETGASFKKLGRNMVTLCPFRRETTPSFTVFPDGYYMCFGCGVHGDHIEFIKAYKNLDFAEAVAELEKFVGPNVILPVSVPQNRLAGRFDPMAGHVSGVDKELVCYLQQNLWAVPERLDYLRGRLFTDETIRREMLGWDDGYYTIPCWDEEPGKSVCLAVRKRASRDDIMPRYKGSEGANQTFLYNKYCMKGADTVFIVAGELDAALMWQDGLPAVSSTNGKNAFKEEWVPLFDHVDRIVIVPDKTPDGEHETAIKIAGLFGVKGRVFRFPEEWNGKDYDEGRMNGHTLADFLRMVDHLL